jgi:hypothetical protein
MDVYYDGYQLWFSQPNAVEISLKCIMNTFIRQKAEYRKKCNFKKECIRRNIIAEKSFNTVKNIEIWRHGIFSDTCSSAWYDVKKV